jgi:pimeloyl-ACP methyl ester carboxylesterase
MAAIAFGVETPNPDIVFLHATGFNARTYRLMLAPLGERFHVWAVDFRGHGRTQLPPRRFGYTSWRQHRDDVIELLDQHASKPVTLAGHSLGGAVSLLVAARRPDLVSSLALIEPVIVPAAFYAMMELPGWPVIARGVLPIARAAARRRARFPDRAAAVAAFTGRGIFKNFPLEAIEDYVADGLVEDAKGGFKLACSPAYESATFAAQRNNPWAALRHVSCPIMVLRAGRDSTFPLVSMHRFAAMKPEALIATVEDAGHMLPIERPDRARAAIESAALKVRKQRRDVD